MFILFQNQPSNQTKIFIEGLLYSSKALFWAEVITRMSKITLSLKKLPI